MLKSTNAIVNVAKNVESFTDVVTPQDVEVSSAILFGTPKPLAKDVVSLVNYSHNWVSKHELSSDILDTLSVTKVGQEYNKKYAKQNMSEIFGYINRPIFGKVSVYKRSGYACSLRGGASTRCATTTP